MGEKIVVLILASVLDKLTSLMLQMADSPRKQQFPESYAYSSFYLHVLQTGRSVALFCPVG